MHCPTRNPQCHDEYAGFLGNVSWRYYPDNSASFIRPTHTKGLAMTERIIRQLIDDLDQSEIVDGRGGSVEFALRGTTYTIDLTDANIAKLDKALAPFVEAAVKASAHPAPKPRSAAASTRRKRAGRRTAKRASAISTATVRAWAAENGHEVSTRGRLPASVSEAYDLAHHPTK
jgi:hypothetical protein